MIDTYRPPLSALEAEQRVIAAKERLDFSVQRVEEAVVCARVAQLEFLRESDAARELIHSIISKKDAVPRTSWKTWLFPMTARLRP